MNDALHKNVAAAQFVGSLLDDFGRAFWIHSIALDEDAFRASLSDLRQGYLSFVLACEIVDRDFLDALLRQLYGDRTTDSPGASGDQCGLERDLHGFNFQLSRLGLGLPQARPASADST